ncbi:hypothetical protein [Cohnella massiliensis]|uniref:hypothetical protein n=1 Tax=Cohnella massiliensis TaxID=1816691 RepID=UPI0009BAA535|nr:hypothetical protein [Cohnella massiliensis]
MRIVAITIDSGKDALRSENEEDAFLLNSAKGQTPLMVGFAGSSLNKAATLAKGVVKRLVSSGYHTMLLENGRGESMRRAAEAAKVLNDA